MNCLLMGLIMNNDETIKFLTKKLEKDCTAITANMVITLIGKQRSEVSQIQVQLLRCQDIIKAQKKTIEKQVKELDRRRLP